MNDDAQRELDMAKASRDQNQKTLDEATDPDECDYYERVVKMWDQYILRLEADLARQQAKERLADRAALADAKKETTT